MESEQKTNEAKQEYTSDILGMLKAAKDSQKEINKEMEDNIKSFRKLKAQEAWIKMNKETLDRMEKHKNGLLRILVYVSLVNFIINLLSLLL